MRISVRVKPGASRTRVGGTYDGVLIVAVQERAVDGKATDAVLRAVAKSLNLRPYEVTLVSGETSRNKVIEVPDSSADEVSVLLAL